MNLVKGYVAESDTDGYKIIKLNSSDQASAATAGTDAAVGVVGQRGAMAGEHINVVHCGEEFVRIGAAVTAGQRFMADANGDAIPLAAAASQTVHYVGFIIQSSTEVGAVVRCVVNPGTVIGA